MIVTAEQAEREHLLRTAEAMAAAARTAPKTKGVDHLETLIVDGAEKARLADEMDAIAAESGAASGDSGPEGGTAEQEDGHGAE